MRSRAVLALTVAVSCAAAAFLAIEVGEPAESVGVAGAAELGRQGPALHGQASWAPGRRPALRVSLRDQAGERVSLGGRSERPVLLTFFDSRCVDECPIAGRLLAPILDEMPAELRPRLMIVSVNPEGDTPASVREAVAAWGLDGPWEWHWLLGTREQLAPVWRAYGVEVEPTGGIVAHGTMLALIDRKGYQRTGYLFPFEPELVAQDLATLAEARG